MGRKPTIKTFVRPPFLAERYCISLETVYERIHAGYIKAKATRTSNITKKPAGFLIHRSEIDRLDRVNGWKPVAPATSAQVEAVA